MRNYATAQNIGGREMQCDATAVHTTPAGTSAYVLLDGIGDSESVQTWTREAAGRLARHAARLGDAETALRELYAMYRARPANADRYTRDYTEKAAAVVVVTAPGRPYSVAWSGDSRAYLLQDGTLRRLTNDHNLRRVYPPTDVYPEGGNRHRITACLGSWRTDEDAMAYANHPAMEAATVPAAPGRLVLVSDGAYEPIEDNGADLATYLAGPPATAAVNLVETAVAWGGKRPDNATALVADLPA
ncbi:PP2C family protein-serine/threonine phosphatase [Streptomyces sp. H27-H5]|uniref:PP2C family protein-serine/threonine phosphatase n=1 Tax=Streptomyces sp. H27-H5 TaxID=2996460 RepID=UPI0022714C1A|nr:mucin-2 [Streptomyces sp. H27-H5]MCY0957709.1 mucin-2 [Streptomyces sp. H27-H5]